MVHFKSLGFLLVLPSTLSSSFFVFLSFQLIPILFLHLRLVVLWTEVSPHPSPLTPTDSIPSFSTSIHLSLSYLVQLWQPSSQRVAVRPLMTRPDHLTLLHLQNIITDPVHPGHRWHLELSLSSGISQQQWRWLCWTADLSKAPPPPFKYSTVSLKVDWLAVPVRLSDSLDFPPVTHYSPCCLSTPQFKTSCQTVSLHLMASGWMRQKINLVHIEDTVRTR